MPPSPRNPRSRRIRHALRAEADAFAGNNSATNVTTVRSVALTISDVEVVEGNSGTNIAVFNVQLSPPTSNTVTVN